MKDFDKELNRMTKVFWTIWIISTIVGIGIWGFFIGMIVILMHYFGVV